MSEDDKKRRENFAKLKFDKLKNLDNYIDPCKIMVHNIPKERLWKLLIWQVMTSYWQKFLFSSIITSFWSRYWFSSHWLNFYEKYWFSLIMRHNLWRNDWFFSKKELNRILIFDDCYVIFVIYKHFFKAHKDFYRGRGETTVSKSGEWQRS